MKKFVFTGLICLLSISSIFSQNLGWEIDEEKSYQIPVGQCSWEEIQQSDFFYLMRENSRNVVLHADATVELAEVLDSKRPTKYEIEAYFGAWDEESLKQLPFFYAFVITMETKYQQPIDFKFIGCNREYDCGGYEEPETLPYFKIYQITEDNQRTIVGKILEKPESSFEEDVLKIIKH